MNMKVTIELIGTEAELKDKLGALLAGPFKGNGTAATLTNTDKVVTAAEVEANAEAEAKAEADAEAAEAATEIKKQRGRPKKTEKAASVFDDTEQKEELEVELTLDDVRDALTKHVKKFSEKDTAALVKKAAGVVRISEIKPKFFGAVVDAVNEALA
jgi:hypothetical protein